MLGRDGKSSNSSHWENASSQSSFLPRATCIRKAVTGGRLQSVTYTLQSFFPFFEFASLTLDFLLCDLFLDNVSKKLLPFVGISEGATVAV